MPERSDDRSKLRAPFSRRKKILFALLMLTVLLGTAEVVLRLMFPRIAWCSIRWFPEDGTEIKADQSEWPPTYPKGGRGVQAYIEFDVPTSFNSDGFRGPDFDPAKGAVVIFIGDSTTAGHGVRYEECFPALVEQALVERFGDMQVWNVGRGGTGPVIQIRLLERILDRYPTADVEAVVMVTSLSPQSHAGNDLIDMRPNLPYLNGGRPAPGRKRQFQLRRWIRQSAVLHGAEILVSRWRRENVRLPKLKNWDELWEDYYKCLDRAMALCDARGASPVVAYLSVPASEDPADIEDVTQRFAQYLDTHGAAFSRCVPKLAPEMQGELWFYPIDGHINALGHRFCATQLIPTIIEVIETRRSGPVE